MRSKRIVTVLIILAVVAAGYVGYTFPRSIESLVGDEVVGIQAESKELDGEKLVYILEPTAVTDKDKIEAVMDICGDYKYSKVLSTEMGIDVLFTKSSDVQKLLMYFTTDGVYKKMQFTNSGTIIIDASEYKIGKFQDGSAEELRLKLIEELSEGV